MLTAELGAVGELIELHGRCVRELRQATLELKSRLGAPGTRVNSVSSARSVAQRRDEALQGRPVEHLRVTAAAAVDSTPRI